MGRGDWEDARLTFDKVTSHTSCVILPFPRVAVLGLTIFGVLFFLSAEEGGCMSVDQDFAITAVHSVGASREHLSAAWWEARSAEELRDIIKRGFAGGEAFQGAVAEAERRAGEVTRRLREEAAGKAAARRKLFKAAAIVTLVTVATIALSAGIWFTP